MLELCVRPDRARAALLVGEGSLLEMAEEVRAGTALAMDLSCTRTSSHRNTHRDIAAAEEEKCCFPHSWSWRLPFESAGRIRFTCRFFRRNIFVGTMLVRVIGVPSTFTNSDTSLHPFFSYFSLGLSTCRTNPQPLAIAIPWPAGIPKGHICRRTMPTLSGSCQCLSAPGSLVSIFWGPRPCVTPWL